MSEAISRGLMTEAVSDSTNRGPAFDTSALKHISSPVVSD